MIPLQFARKRVVPESYLTDAERVEIREMLEFYRRQRPLWEAITTECPTARRLSEAD